MRVLLVTVSARGHAIADALQRSGAEIVHVCPSRNPGIRALASEQIVVDSLMEFEPIVEIAKNVKPDFAFIAPDDPIGAGLVDALQAVGVESIAPKQILARIESSKSFTRELLEQYGIDASPQFRVFTSEDGMGEWMEALQGEYVVKFDGLAGGKGVKVSGEHLATIEDGIEFALECLEKTKQVVVEEKLIGPEFSLMSFVSGTRVVSMPAVQDHKRAYEGDTGPNTGGMGSYSDADHSLPFLQESDLLQAHSYNEATAEALQSECGEPFNGILYGGFIVTRGGVKLIEYNARFGDPEALNVLPLLNSSFSEICLSMLAGELNTNLVQFENKATVCLYITPECYPNDKYLAGEVIELPTVIPSSARIYYGDVTEGDDGALHLGGSRTVGIVGIGETIEEARRIALDLCMQVKGPIRYRDDIGTTALIQKKIDLTDRLRS